MTESEAQKALAAIALELLVIDEKLGHIREVLPQSPGREAMWEYRIPYDVATEVHGTIECLRQDNLRPMIEQLEMSSRITEEELRQRFDRQG